MFNIIKITAEQPSVDHCRFYNKNAMDKFQITWKILHWPNANQRQ